jgi:hypothetical protein
MAGHKKSAKPARPGSSSFFRGLPVLDQLALRITPGLDNDDWLAAMAKRCRAALCQEDLRVDLMNGNWATALHFLQANKICPGLLAVPILLYVDGLGINRFCEPLDNRQIDLG